MAIAQKNLHNKILGKNGEELARLYLIQNSFQIITQNFRTRFGEIDIVAQKNNIVYCIEVKTRSSLKFGYPIEAINQKKLDRMYLTAQLFIERNKMKNQEFKLAVVEVLHNTSNFVEL